MPADIKIFISCKKPGTRVPNNALVHPIQVGTARSSQRITGLLHDDEGENISLKASEYGDLAGQFWAWKNAKADYYGFLPANRYFVFSGDLRLGDGDTSHKTEAIFDCNNDAALERIAFNETSMRKVIESHDLVTSVPVTNKDGKNVYEQYRTAASHHIEDLDCVLDLIEFEHPEIWQAAQQYVAQTACYSPDAFVMRADLFDGYASFLFDVLEHHDRLADVSHYTATAREVSSYLGEVLYGIYLTYLLEQGFNGIELRSAAFREVSEGPLTGLPAGEVLGGISFGGVTRGNGKIFVPLSFDTNVSHAIQDPGSRLIAVSETSDGKRVPAKTICYRAERVLVVPVLNVEQTVTVEAYNAAGSVVAVGSRGFSPRISMLESKKNTFLHNDRVISVRNCDSKLRLDDMRVIVDKIKEDGDRIGTDTVTGRVLIPVLPFERTNDPLEILALDGMGADITTRDWVCLGDRSEIDPTYPQMRIRIVSFSLCIPRVPSFTVWVKREGSDGFACIETFVAEDLRNKYLETVTPASSEPEYDKWFREVHRSSWTELEMQRSRLFQDGPTFSIIIPLYKTPLDFLHEAIDSVVSQTYGKWELVLVNSTPEVEELTKAVDDYCHRDARIRCVTLDSNLGITLNTNEGIKVAKGDFLCFFDHDDVLEPGLLYWYADALEKNPQIDLLYCDEDKLHDGHYEAPFFKPDWNPDLLMAENYVCHLLTVRKTIVDGLELPGKEYDGSQDHHMTFRVAEKARCVCHIPRVLYHWRMHANSTSVSTSQKNYAFEAGLRAVKAHLDRCGIQGTVEESPIAPGHYAIRYDFGATPPLVSIIIPNKDAVTTLNRCITSIRQHTTYKNYEIIIVENNSTQKKTFEYYRDLEEHDDRIKVITLKGMSSFNYSRICNFGAQASHGEYLLMLNNDTEVITSDWIESLLGPCSRKDVGATGALLLYPDGTIQHAGVANAPEGPLHLYKEMPLYRPGNFEAARIGRDVTAVTGACLMIRRDVYDLVNGMDELFAINYNDIDLCYKIRDKGYKIVYCPEARLYHYESVSRGKTNELVFCRERARLMDRWPEAFELPDPNGNPNFIRQNEFQKLNVKDACDFWH